MEQTSEHKRNYMRYALPILGAAIPVAAMLFRKGSTEEIEWVDEETTKSEALLEESSLNLQGAMHKALKFVHGTPVEVELEEYNGMPVWEVEIVPQKGGPTREVLIDARSGDILQITSKFATCD